MAIYLDNAATTFLDKQVVRLVSSLSREKVANPASLHHLGVRAAVWVEHSRQIMAKRIHADPQEIYFFSGGTEANNTVIKGVASARKKHGNHVIVSAIEHPSILEPARWLQRQGLHVSYVKVDREGAVDPGDVARLITSKTILVSVMHANNEIGTIQPLRAIGQLCRKKEIYFHTDACQSFTKVPIDVRRDFLDIATLNSHKIHGPRGVAALFIRKGVAIEPLLHGGHQEDGLRAGTYNTEGIAGFGKAVEIVDGHDIRRMEQLRDYFISHIEGNITGAVLNGSRRSRLCNN
ncbi:MAG: cysteine desulfurase family protein, partial [Candidatus Omnitrophota bacterium]